VISLSSRKCGGVGRPRRDAGAGGPAAEARPRGVRRPAAERRSPRGHAANQLRIWTSHRPGAFLNVREGERHHLVRKAGITRVSEPVASRPRP